MGVSIEQYRTVVGTYHPRGRVGKGDRANIYILLGPINDIITSLKKKYPNVTQILEKLHIQNQIIMVKIYKEINIEFVLKYM